MSIPLHEDTRFANQSLYWTGSDTKELWQKNMNDTNNCHYFKKNGWDDEFAITYEFNSNGFRYREFDEFPPYIAVGCSFTSGIGLPVEKTWPHLLSKLVDNPIANLGIGGASLDTCFRIIEYFISNFDVRGVFLLEPELARFELFHNNMPINLLPGYADFDGYKERPFYKTWITSEDNMKYNVMKNRYAIQHVCNINSVHLLSSPMIRTDPAGDIIDLARDLMHFGPLHQKKIANTFLEKFNALNK